MSAPPPPSPSLAATRVGLVIPSVNAVIEPEYYRVAPPGFSFHSVRIMLREDESIRLERAKEHARGFGHTHDRILGLTDEINVGRPAEKGIHGLLEPLLVCLVSPVLGLA